MDSELLCSAWSHSIIEPRSSLCIQSEEQIYSSTADISNEKRVSSNLKRQIATPGIQWWLISLLYNKKWQQKETRKKVLKCDLRTSLLPAFFFFRKKKGNVTQHSIDLSNLITSSLEAVRSSWQVISSKVLCYTSAAASSFFTSCYSSSMN